MLAHISYSEWPDLDLQLLPSINVDVNQNSIFRRSLSILLKSLNNIHSLKILVKYYFFEPLIRATPRP